MSFGDPNNPYGAPQGGQGYPQQQPGGYPQQPGYPQQQPPQQPGYPQQQPQQPGYGYPQAPQGVPQQQSYGYPQAPQAPQGYDQYGQQQGGYGYGQPEYAHWGLRLGASLIDGLILMAPLIVFAIIGGLAGPDSALVVVSIGYLVAFGVGIWMLVQEGQTGQTIGKKTCGIRLLREADGQPLGIGMAFVRRLAHILDSAACYIGWLWPLWDEKKQTFADKVCSSVVVTAPKV